MNGSGMRHLSAMLLAVAWAWALVAPARADDAPAPVALPVADVKRDAPVSFEIPVRPNTTAKAIAHAHTIAFRDRDMLAANHRQPRGSTHKSSKCLSNSQARIQFGTSGLVIRHSW